MNKLLRIGIASIFLIVGQLDSAMAQSDNSSIGSPVSATDEAAIRAILERQTDAWNKHDMDAFVADTVPNVDWINVVGRHWKGRETVRGEHAKLHTASARSGHHVAREPAIRRVLPDEP